MHENGKWYLQFWILMINIHIMSHSICIFMEWLYLCMNINISCLDLLCSVQGDQNISLKDMVICWMICVYWIQMQYYSNLDLGIAQTFIFFDFLFVYYCIWPLLFHCFHFYLSDYIQMELNVWILVCVSKSYMNIHSIFMYRKRRHYALSWCILS